VIEDKTLKEKLRESSHTLFYLWEFLSSAGMQDDAREYLEEHEDNTVPFEIAL
jgi:hypothetical protein